MFFRKSFFLSGGAKLAAMQKKTHYLRSLWKKKKCYLNEIQEASSFCMN